MNIIKQIKTAAFWRWIDGYGYAHTESKKLWQSKRCAWNHFYLRFGIRRSEIPQRFPVWNMSNNSSRSLMFGFGFWFIQFDYHRKKSFRQGNGRYIPKSRWGRKTWQLFF